METTCAIAFSLASVSSKYLTYKEWKQSFTVNTDLASLRYIYVSTLPIRNGNSKTINQSLFNNSIERRKYLTYKEWKHYTELFLC